MVTSALVLPESISLPERPLSSGALGPRWCPHPLLSKQALRKAGKSSHRPPAVGAAAERPEQVTFMQLSPGVLCLKLNDSCSDFLLSSLTDSLHHFCSLPFLTFHFPACFWGPAFLPFSHWTPLSVPSLPEMCPGGNGPQSGCVCFLTHLLPALSLQTLSFSGKCCLMLLTPVLCAQ